MTNQAKKLKPSTVNSPTLKEQITWLLRKIELSHNYTLNLDTESIPPDLSSTEMMQYISHSLDVLHCIQVEYDDKILGNNELHEVVTHHLDSVVSE